MKAELKRAADLVAFQRREALARKRLSGDPRNPFRPRYGAELTFTAAAQEAETLGYILKLLEKEAARECARRVIPTLDAILDFVIGFGLLALAMLGVAAACVAAGAPDSITRTAALLGVGFIAARRRDRDVAAVSKLHSLRRPLGREVPPGAHRGPQARPPEGREGNGSMTAGREGQECRTYSSP